jgi:hypothetical protein
MRSPFLLPLYVSALALCLGAAASSAQTSTGRDVLSGRITDLTGKPIAEAQVTVFSSGSSVTRTAMSDADGHYRIFFPETAAQYVLHVKRLGFAPVDRTITRHTSESERMTIDFQLGGAPLALSMVEINGGGDAPPVRETSKAARVDAIVPNPVAEILAMKDTLHLSAVQIVGLTELADSLQARNSLIYRNVQTLLAKSQEAGDARQMAGSVAMLLEEASGNTARAVAAARELLRPEQWQVVPQVIRDRPADEAGGATRQL